MTYNSISHHTFIHQFWHPLMILASNNYYCGVCLLVISISIIPSTFCNWNSAITKSYLFSLICLFIHLVTYISMGSWIFSSLRVIICYCHYLLCFSNCPRFLKLSQIWPLGLPSVYINVFIRLPSDLFKKKKISIGKCQVISLHEGSWWLRLALLLPLGPKKSQMCCTITTLAHPRPYDLWSVFYTHYYRNFSSLSLLEWGSDCSWKKGGGYQEEPFMVLELFCILTISKSTSWLWYYTIFTKNIIIVTGETG